MEIPHGSSLPFAVGTVISIESNVPLPNASESIFSRTTEEKWSQEETDKWFTVPTEKEIENLSNANDKIINSIVEAAPWQKK